MDTCSTTGANLRQMAMNALEFLEYSRKSGGASTSCGHFRSAMPTGSPVVTPNFFAGMDLARMMPVRLSRSPPIADGISRRSASPAATRRAASHDKNALFTST